MSRMDDDARYMGSRGLQSPVRSAMLLADVQVQAVDDWCLNGAPCVDHLEATLGVVSGRHHRCGPDGESLRESCFSSTYIRALSTALRNMTTFYAQTSLALSCMFIKSLVALSSSS